MGMRIDLHTHSDVSDGTDTPWAVVADAAATGLDVVALTDHDSTAGWDEAAASAREHGIMLIRGMELSAAFGPRTVHLLSYLHDPETPGLVEYAAEIRESRVGRAQRMVDLLAEDFPITWEDVIGQTSEGTATIGRPHIADALVAAGVASDRSQAFESLLHNGTRYYVRNALRPAAEAVTLIREAGGVAVLAHPAAIARGGILSDASIGRLVEAGLQGLEVDHRDNPPEQRARLRRLAEQWQLLTTGSSDYHGDGKPNRLGENLTAPSVLDAIIERGTLEAVAP